MAWYNRSGPGQDVFISTRVRLARNLNGYPLGHRLTDSMAKELTEKVASLFPASEGYETTRMWEISPVEAGVLAEKHYISPEFAESTTPRLLIREESKGLAMMVCEEDHLRIQCLTKGFSPEECKRGAFEAEERIDVALPIAFSDQLGYLTHCPTNLGTGMRLSVMMFLPALTYAGHISSLLGQLQKMGLVMRGMQGEGSQGLGCLYQISNQVTLGISEEETIRKVSDVVRRIAETERNLRQSYEPLQKLKLLDKAHRAEGIFRHGELLSTAEFFALWADLRLGVSIEEQSDISYEKLDTMVFEAMPSEMTLEVTPDTAAFSADVRRDAARAKAIRRILGGVTESHSSSKDERTEK